MNLAPRKHRRKAKTKNVKGLPGIREYRWAVEEALYGTYAFASEQQALALCAKQANNIRKRHQRGTSPRQAAVELAEMAGLAPLEGIATSAANTDGL